MNVKTLTDLLKKLSPILKAMGMDPNKIINKFGRDKLAPYWERAKRETVIRLENDGLTPALKAQDPDTERVLIRMAMFFHAKHAAQLLLADIPGVRGLGANVRKRVAGLIGDAARDAHDEKLVAELSPQVEPTTTTAAFVDLMSHAFFERLN